jgi:hypothetical protein
MYINLANSSKFTTDAIQVYFTSTAITSLTLPGIINVTPQLINATGNMPDSTSWIPVSGTYTATGGEQYIIIGNFLPDNAMTLVQLYPFPAWDHSYIIVDDVLLTVCTALNTVYDQSSITVYPDYSSKTIHLKINKPGNYHIRMFDTTGRVFYDADAKDNLIIPAEHFGQGIIFYTVSEAGGRLINGKIFWE